MAVTGMILFGFILGHLAGNLQAFEGREKFDAYAQFLRSMQGALYAVRLILLAAVTLHIVTTVQLARLKMASRPDGYAKKDNSHSSYASRTMYWSGPIVAAFVIYHLLQFTFLVTDSRFVEGHVYDNLVLAFEQPAVVAAYVIAMILLGLHLSHGIYSMLQSIGVLSPVYTPFVKTAARVLALVITLGFISIPVAVMTGIIHL